MNPSQRKAYDAGFRLLRKDYYFYLQGIYYHRLGCLIIKEGKNKWVCMIRKKDIWKPICSFSTLGKSVEYFQRLYGK